MVFLNIIGNLKNIEDLDKTKSEKKLCITFLQIWDLIDLCI
jgi:hypothetical protein